MTTRPDGIPVLVKAGWTERVDLGEGRAVLFYDDGPARFEHVCHRVRDDRVLIIAPSLENHTIVSRDPLTITASIACWDCPIHGWVRDGQWVPA